MATPNEEPMKLWRKIPGERLLDPKRNDKEMLEVRKRMPALMAEGVGRADPADLNYNDPYMQAVRKQGVPTANRATMWTPPKGDGGTGAEPMPSPPVRPAEPRRPVGPMDGMMPMRAPTEPLPGSRVGSSAMNRGVKPGFAMEGPLSGRGARPMGRSMAEAPERRLETAARYGDMRAARGLMEMKQAREQGATERMRMYLEAQNAQATLEQQQWKDARERMFKEQDHARDQAEELTKEDRTRQWEMTKEDRRNQFEMTKEGLKAGYDAMDFERTRNQAEADRKAKLDFGLRRLDTPDSSTSFYQNYEGGIQAGTAPRGLSKPPEGMVPQGATVDGVRYGPPAGKEEKMPKFQSTTDGKLFYVVPNGKGGFVRKFVDEDGDGKPDAAPQGGGASPATTSSGIKFKMVEPKM